jgi:hypothetical protein
MPASPTPTRRAPSADSLPKDTRPARASTPTLRQRLLRLKEKLRRLRSHPAVVTLPRPADSDGLADVLDLIGAKVMTLALELRTAPGDPATIEHTMTALQDCYITLAQAVEPETRWSRA